MGNARIKKQAETFIGQWIVASRVPFFKGPVSLDVAWYEPDRRRDRDNVETGIKFILDALKKCGRIPNDTRRFVRDIRHRVLVDRANPHVSVTIFDDDRTD